MWILSVHVLHNKKIYWLSLEESVINIKLDLELT